MTDKDLGDSLLKVSLLPAVAPTGTQTEEIIAADRLRIRRLARWTVGLWIAAALGMLVIFIGGGLVFPMLAKMLEESGQGSLDRPDTPLLLLAKLTAMCIVMGSLSFALLTSAGLATVLLVFRSRGATLRQINANLLAISEQLEALSLRERAG